MKFILHSVSYSSAWKGQTALSLEGVVDKAIELGFDGIELMAKRPHASPIDMGKEERRSLREKLKDNNLELACIAGYQDFSTSLDYPDMPILEKELLYLRETIRLAHDLECKIVRIYSGYLRPNIPFQDQWDWCVAYIREAARFAENEGVLLALQNHSEITVHHQDVLQMIEEVGSPAMRVALDAPYVQKTAVPIEQAVTDVASLLAYSTASDHTSRVVSLGLAPTAFRMAGYYELTKSLAVPLGDGIVDYRAFFAALKKVGYDSYMAYEICSPIRGGGSEGNLDLCAKRSLDYLRRLQREVFGG